MILILSGEGPSDLGMCTNAQGRCSDHNFQSGPITVLLEQLIERRLGYALADAPGAIQFISKPRLVELAVKRKNNKRSVILPGKKRGVETGYFHANALDLGQASLEIETELNDITIAVLFRDHDKMRSDPPALWQQKWQSMLDGFHRAQFPRGVPMLPNPKSEAWLLCAAKKQPFQHCAKLEDVPGNDDAPNSAKEKLARALGGEKSAVELAEWVRGIEFDAQGASAMPSFAAFHDRLQLVLGEMLH
ncbi:hypothetical protein [Janthinobacterium sp. PC23-8]|uniref:hypothetical protein n=1 Tax=Janthinobacterium sp. PC23-8 TaxID=2012679 RepID=UPI000B96C4CA|nr:hypothetical protein [Janthinobacterium sp. PC23-8]OYO29776.1 hypothetical protein CD932_00470 [Janthinobacterium sp. PC23-8]